MLHPFTMTNRPLEIEHQGTADSRLGKPCLTHVNIKKENCTMHSHCVAFFMVTATPFLFSSARREAIAFHMLACFDGLSLRLVWEGSTRLVFVAMIFSI